MYKKSYRVCKHCGKDIVSSRHNDHETKCLNMQSEKLAASLRSGGHQVGTPAWNKGLRAETDARVLQNATSNAGKISPHRGKKLKDIVGEERSIIIRSNISKGLSINNKGGRCKWFDVSGQKVQGTWERNVAEKLDELGIRWEKLKVHRHTFEYEMDGNIRHYTPDFYLPELDFYLEVKGHWWGRDREKMDLVIAKYPTTRFVILEKQQYERFMGGELVW